MALACFGQPCLTTSLQLPARRGSFSGLSSQKLNHWAFLLAGFWACCFLCLEFSGLGLVLWWARSRPSGLDQVSSLSFQSGSHPLDFSPIDSRPSQNGRHLVEVCVWFLFASSCPPWCELCQAGALSISSLLGTHQSVSAEGGTRQTEGRSEVVIIQTSHSRNWETCGILAYHPLMHPARSLWKPNTSTFAPLK